MCHLLKITTDHLIFLPHPDLLEIFSEPHFIVPADHINVPADPIIIVPADHIINVPSDYTLLSRLTTLLMSRLTIHYCPSFPSLSLMARCHCFPRRMLSLNVTIY